jgi:hypothetical protein
LNLFAQIAKPRMIDAAISQAVPDLVTVRHPDELICGRGDGGVKNRIICGRNRAPDIDLTRAPRRRAYELLCLLE